jgi:hypothetical protein
MSEILNKTFGETTTTVTTSRYNVALTAVLETLDDTPDGYEHQMLAELIERTIHEVLESVDTAMYHENFSEKEREIVMATAIDYCTNSLFEGLEETRPDTDTVTLVMPAFQSGAVHNAT